MRKSSRFVTRVISGQTLLLPLFGGDEGRCLYQLSETAAFLWEQMQGAFTEASLAARLLEAFDATAEQAHRDVRALVGDLRQLGALEDAAQSERDETAMRAR